MKQDVNNIVNILNSDWAQDMANSKRKTAILSEENRMLKEENERLEARVDKLTEEKEGKNED